MRPFSSVATPAPPLSSVAPDLPAPLAAVAQRARAGGDGNGKPLLAITFDDGYRNNLTHAAPLLDEYGLNRPEPEKHNVRGGGPHVYRQFATNCLLARRLVERGVRFVTVLHASWDHHSNIDEELGYNAGMADQPIAALLKDLKRRGLLDSTLVLFAGEFGRTPVVELPAAGANAGKVNGRDHNHYGFSMWLAGGGARGGYVHGATDEFGFAAVDDKVHVHDLHATILQCLGFDHTKLTYRFNGRDFRLTDVAGNVVKPILA